MSAQLPASPSANVPPPVPKDANVGTLSRPVTASSVGGYVGSTPPGTSQGPELGPSRLVIPEAVVASSTTVLHGDPTRPPRTPPGPDNPFKSPEGSQITQQYDSQSRTSHRVGMSADQGNSASLLPNNGDSHPLPPPPPQPVRLSDRPPVARQWTGGGTRLSNRRSAIDWIVPVSEEGEAHDQEKPLSPYSRTHHAYALTYKQRLEPTVQAATEELKKYEEKAKTTGWALNIAIGLQVLLGSLTTGLSAVATSGRSAAVSTTILGGLSTVVASYLARARGSNEPELSITRSKDLQQFLRECSSFEMDYGYVIGTEHDEELRKFRSRFEELLGNADGQRKLSPPV